MKFVGENLSFIFVYKSCTEKQVVDNEIAEQYLMEEVPSITRILARILTENTYESCRGDSQLHFRVQKL